MFARASSPSERGEWRVDRRGHRSVGFTSVREILGSHEEHRVWVVFLMVARGLVAVGGRKVVLVFGQVSETCLRGRCVFVRFVPCRERPRPPAPAPRPSSFSRAKFGPPLPLPLIRSFLCCCTGRPYRRFHAHPDAQLRLGGIPDAPRKPAEFVSGGRRTDGNLLVIAGQLFGITVKVLCAITGQSYVCACLFPE